MGFIPKSQAGLQDEHGGGCPQILGCTRGARREGHTAHGAVVKPRQCHPLPVPPHSHHNPTELISSQPLENKTFPSLIREEDSHYCVKRGSISQPSLKSALSGEVLSAPVCPVWGWAASLGGIHGSRMEMEEGGGTAQSS